MRRLLTNCSVVPCDGRVLEARDLFVNEALLTGEAYPVEKAPTELPGTTEANAATNAVLMGTAVISGSGNALNTNDILIGSRPVLVSDGWPVARTDILACRLSGLTCEAVTALTRGATISESSFVTPCLAG